MPPTVFYSAAEALNMAGLTASWQARKNAPADTLEPVPAPAVENEEMAEELFGDEPGARPATALGKVRAMLGLNTKEETDRQPRRMAPPCAYRLPPELIPWPPSLALKKPKF